jgi:hypothetical protein
MITGRGAKLSVLDAAALTRQAELDHQNLGSDLEPGF